MRGKSICAASVGDGRLPFRSLLWPSWVFLSREGVLQEFLMQMEMHACIARLSLLVSCSGLDESVPRWCLLSDYICRPRWSMDVVLLHRSTGSNRVTSAEEKAYLMEWSGRILRSLYSAHRCIHCSCDGDDGAPGARCLTSKTSDSQRRASTVSVHSICRMMLLLESLVGYFHDAAGSTTEQRPCFQQMHITFIQFIQDAVVLT